MKKKLGLLFASLTSLLCFTSCTNTKIDGSSSSSITPISGEYYVLCSHSVGDSDYLKFILDGYTNNIYVIHHGYFKGSISPYYNSKGEIMKYDEFQKVHIH